MIPTPLLQLVYRAVSERAAQTLKIAEDNKLSLLTIALDHLTLGRAALYAAILESGPQSPLCGLADGKNRTGDCADHIAAAVSGLGRAGTQHGIRRALLTCAWLRALTPSTVSTGSLPATSGLAAADSAQSDLDEAWEIAARGPMPLFMADLLLTRARLFGNRIPHGGDRKEDAPYPWATATNPKGEIVHHRTAKDDLEDAEHWIRKCGYHRRDEELADAKRAIVGG